MSFNPMFLFQTGAIRSLSSHRPRSQQIRFYSKLVRLEVNSVNYTLGLLMSFYSKLVRLEVRIIYL